MDNKLFKLSFLAITLIAGLFVQNSFSQNLHNVSNAVSFENESNSTIGWISTATLTSDTENPFHGQYSFRGVTSPTNGREIRFTFPAIIGQTYNISIWARQGSYSHQPAFANWSGFSGFATRLITESNWTEYTFSLIATSATPIIRAYTSPSTGPIQGSTIFLDRISIFNAADTQPPTSPQNLSLISATESAISINWEPSADNTGIAAYDIFINNQLSDSVSGTQNSFTLQGLPPLTSFDFYVTARDAAGNSSTASNTLTASTLPDTIAPSVPEGLQTSDISSNSFGLSWLPSTDNIVVAGYEIHLDSTLFSTTSGNTNQFLLSGLGSGTTYQVAVAAFDQAGNISAYSIPLLVTTQAPDTTPPSAPEGLQAESITQTSFVLSWNASFDNSGINSYEVFIDSVSYSLTDGNNTQLLITGLTPGSTYQARVSATDLSGNVSLLSNPLAVTTMESDNIPPSAVTGLKTLEILKTSAQISWNESTDNISVAGYRIFVENSLLASTSDTIYQISDLTAATGYEIIVVAFDDAGNVSTGDSLTFITLNAITYTDLNANNPDTDWNARNFYAAGTVGIQTQPDSVYLLSVNGAIRAKEIIVETGWADFVFEEDYPLPSLQEVEEHILKFGHLKDIPPAGEIARNGTNLGEISVKLLQKIEELTLYTIQLEKRLKALETENNNLKQQTQ